MTRIGKVLPKLLRDLHLESQLEGYKVLTRWPEVVGASVSAHVTPLSFRGGRLTVRVDHPVWSHELNLLKPELLKRLNQDLHPPVIHDIRFTL